MNGGNLLQRAKQTSRITAQAKEAYACHVPCLYSGASVTSNLVYPFANAKIIAYALFPVHETGYKKTPLPAASMGCLLLYRSTNRADIGARATIYALVRFDFELGFAFADALLGTFRFASTAVDASIGNLICHSSAPPVFTHLRVIELYMKIGIMTSEKR
jgi:hypothetical protein